MSRKRSKSKLRIRKDNLKKLYGITLDDYYLILSNQNNACAICKTDVEEFNKNLSVDHNHETGQVRGLLCDRCNHGLGKFYDDPSYIKEALHYLYINDKQWSDVE